MTTDVNITDHEDNQLPRFDRVQRSFHWVMAAIILLAIVIGFYCWLQTPGTPSRRALLEVHKSLGMSALVLLAFRVAYRLAVGAPGYARPLGRLTHIAAEAAHLVLYVLMLFMPLTGYMFSGAGGYSLPWFGLFQWPRLLPRDDALAHVGQTLHGLGAYVIYAVLAAHVAAVAWHHFVKKDEVLGRMLPPRR
ncbi:cytochrome b [Bradyrhizobium septentrionale]|nr:cytochrome b [Bradyrhizobium septentrionale]UGY19201.1 cytochrome b [Bradyrhizobium septentrionale]UGY27935.1 cytochrome b [Bradyrhizobium septentrionale]